MNFTLTNSKEIVTILKDVTTLKCEIKSRRLEGLYEKDSIIDFSR